LPRYFISPWVLLQTAKNVLFCLGADPRVNCWIHIDTYLRWITSDGDVTIKKIYIFECCYIIFFWQCKKNDLAFVYLTAKTPWKSLCSTLGSPSSRVDRQNNFLSGFMVFLRVRPQEYSVFLVMRCTCCFRFRFIGCCCLLASLAWQTLLEIIVDTLTIELISTW